MIYLLDTNHASRLLLGEPVLHDRVASTGLENIAISFVVSGELHYMAQKSERRDENLRVVQRFCQRLSIIHSDNETCAIYGDLKRAFLERFGPKSKKKRRGFKLRQMGVDDNDLWIAAVAIRNEFTVVSADSDFQRLQVVREFPLETWWAP